MLHQEKHPKKDKRVMLKSITISSNENLGICAS